MKKRAYPTRLERLGRHKSYGPLGEYLEFGDLFWGIRSTVYCKGSRPHFMRETSATDGVHAWDS